MAAAFERQLINSKDSFPLLRTVSPGAHKIDSCGIPKGKTLFSIILIMGYRPLHLADAADIAKIHRRAIFSAVEKFPDLHTPAQDLDFFNSELATSKGYAYLGSDEEIQGFILWRENWINHLYLDSEILRLGIGSNLLKFASGEIEGPLIQLFTFQSNTGAVAFYLKHGFTISRAGDGSGNQEGLPDFLLILQR